MLNILSAPAGSVDLDDSLVYYAFNFSSPVIAHPIISLNHI